MMAATASLARALGDRLRPDRAVQPRPPQSDRNDAPRLSIRDEGLEGRRVVRMPAGEGGAVLDHVADRPGDPLLIERAVHVVVGA